MHTYKKLGDNDLSALVGKGDELAYLEIYNRYQPILFLHAVKKFRDEEEAKDVVQEIFADIWLRRNDFKLQSNLVAYLYTCLKYKFVNKLQHQEVRNRYLSSFQGYIDKSSTYSDYLIREKQLSEIIANEIDKLPPKMKAVFLLSRNEHKSYKEIAEELNLSEETVRSQIKNSLKLLRERLGIFIWLFFIIFY